MQNAQGNIDVDVVTDALKVVRKESKSQCIQKQEWAMAVLVRDNIALRYMAEKLDLQYDIFDAIMNAREIQAKNLAKYLVKIAEEKELPHITKRCCIQTRCALHRRKLQFISRTLL